MKMKQHRERITSFGILILLLWTSTSDAQTFTSGSTGADGALAPIADTVLVLPPDGIFNFTTVNIPAGVTVRFTANAANTAVTILATGNVNVDGILDLNGGNGSPVVAGVLLNQGGRGGPGGFPGGTGGQGGGLTQTKASAGQGPGEGVSGSPGNYGAPFGFVSLIPLFGGSGGGGGLGGNNGGPSGGGGGGAIVIASSTQITVKGTVTAKGGDGWTSQQSNCGFRSGPGSGGAIRLVAPLITGSGLLEAAGGRTVYPFGFAACLGGGSGRTRLEAFNQTFTGPASRPSFSVAPGPVTPASRPALINLPTLTISTVGGVSSPSIPSGSYITADVSLPSGTINPVLVTVSMTHTPVGTTFIVNIIPQFALPTASVSAPSTGTFASSSATAHVTLPLGQVSVLNAFASFTLPTQLASLVPGIDGEPVESVMLAANMGQPSTLSFITKSGKQVPAKGLIDEKQLALLWNGVMIQK